ncbi:MAG: transglycosylase domain-containing protein [Planctomycetota bacterium]
MSGCGTPIAPGTAPSAPEPREEGALAAPATLSTSGGRSRGRRRLRRVLALLLLPPLVGVGALILLDRLFPFPIEQLVPASSSALERSREEVPLLATVARDDQWRIRVPLAAIDPRLIEATVAVEDERFRRHPGVDPLSIARAVGQNLSAGEVVSGASTITMQLCRLLHPRPRTLRSKMIEAFRALQLERLLGKERILEEYLNRAPYGGNLVGVEAAARHYLGRGAGDLSLAEAALLAGLPQGPSILRPDRHPERARRRRDTVLRRMHEEGRITAEERRTAEATPSRSSAGERSPTGSRAPSHRSPPTPPGGRWPGTRAGWRPRST